MASCPTVCWFGVLSARVTRYCHLYYLDGGHRLFAYQPPRFSEDLWVLYDADFLHPEGYSMAVNPGVTWGLLLTSKALYQSPRTPRITFSRPWCIKWRLISRATSLQSKVQARLEVSQLPWNINSVHTCGFMPQDKECLVFVSHM